MKKVYGYTRVSTLKQGVQGVSLQEQRSAIEAFAARNNLDVVAWFEEKETAAKSGRPIFSQMISALRAGKASGVAIHKIDRSARNLRDWAELGQLIDSGVDIYFANEGIDLSTRGGRLSADLQAVIAADFIRNLREETRKGLSGRLKQGIYPFKAPIGYLDTGKAQPKALDPKFSPLIRACFENYSTGRYSLDQLRHKMAAEGLVDRRGDPLRINRMSTILNNPFYYGLMRVGTTGETFPGKHEPLISVSLYRACQEILNGRSVARPYKHDYLYRRQLTCKDCGYTLIGERQKGHIYYRCHTKGCLTRGLREEVISDHVHAYLKTIGILDQVKPHLLRLATTTVSDRSVEISIDNARLKGQIKDLQARLDRVTDAFLDGDIDKDTYISRKERYATDQAALEERLKNNSTNYRQRLERFEEFLERGSALYSRYISGSPVQKRDILKTTTSNRLVSGKYVQLEPRPPFHRVAEVASPYHCAHSRGLPRTFDENTACVREEELNEEVVRKLFERLWRNFE